MPFRCCTRRRYAPDDEPGMQQVTVDAPRLLGRVPSEGVMAEKGGRRRLSVIGAADIGGELADEALRGHVLLQQVAAAVDEEADEMTAADADSRPSIAIVGHEQMVPLMKAFVESYKECLSDFRIVTSESLHELLVVNNGLTPVTSGDVFVPSSALGGDQVIGSMIAEEDVRAVFFFRDPLSCHAPGSDFEALSRLADVYQIYFASNYRTAAATLEALQDRMSAVKMGATASRVSMASHGLLPGNYWQAALKDRGEAHSR
eukprot:TRINITY_DN7370_c0_g3_i1.p1 TRINITY_DN7370_c0_g3~~TRINITY_DN7370_c0_g3_i1.p1  ORF type:complete len:286 (-),score=60.12 TRINITY_DN7370_c0_g3_i1:30-809(-)